MACLPDAAGHLTAKVPCNRGVTGLASPSRQRHGPADIRAMFNDWGQAMNIRKVTARLAVATVVASTALIGFTGGTASAGVGTNSIWQLDDGFDSQPASTWRVESYGT